MNTQHKDYVVHIPVGLVRLEGILCVPPNIRGMVIFAHGSGSSRLSARNSFVAKEFHKRDIGTLLFDLLSEEEDLNYENRFDIHLLTQRLIASTEWLLKRPELKGIPIGYFGASTGAAAAINAAAELGKDINAVVSRGGRPDLAELALQDVNSPTLLIVGADDADAMGLNEDALEKINSRIKELSVIPGATHLFEEPGTLERVAELASLWFEKYLKR